jgi:Protein of unknown function (DUF3352)
MGTQDPQKQLEDSAKNDGDLDWEHDVAPFLGGNAAVYVHGFDLFGASFEGAVILRCNDAGRALQVVLDEEGGSFEPATYNGVTYQADAFSGVYAASLDGHLVLAMSETSMQEVIDVHAGKKDSLATVSNFQNLRDELSHDFLAFVYISTKDLLGGTILSDPLVKSAFDQAGAGDLAFKPFAAVIGARGNAFQFQAASLGKADAVSPLLQPHESRFVKLVPADAAIFFTTNDVAQTRGEVVKAAGKQIDDAIAEQGEYRNLQDVLTAGGREMGISSAQDLIDLFTGETAVAAWFPNDDQDKPEFVLLADVTDPAHAADVLGKVAAASSSPTGRPHSETVSGAQVTLFTDEDGTASAFAIKDGYMLLGSEGGVRKTLAGGANLGGTSDYTQTVKQMPSSLGTYAYLDMAPLLRLASPGEVPSELDDAQKALQGLILNLVEERDIVRFSGVLSVKP